MNILRLVRISTWVSKPRYEILGATLSIPLRIGHSICSNFCWLYFLSCFAWTPAQDVFALLCLGLQTRPALFVSWVFNWYSQGLSLCPLSWYYLLWHLNILLRSSCESYPQGPHCLARRNKEGSAQSNVPSIKKQQNWHHLTAGHGTSEYCLSPFTHTALHLQLSKGKNVPESMMLNNVSTQGGKKS